MNPERLLVNKLPYQRYKGRGNFGTLIQYTIYGFEASYNLILDEFKLLDHSHTHLTASPILWRQVHPSQNEGRRHKLCLWWFEHELHSYATYSTYLACLPIYNTSTSRQISYRRWVRLLHCDGWVKDAQLTQLLPSYLTDASHLLSTVTQRQVPHLSRLPSPLLPSRASPRSYEIWRLVISPLLNKANQPPPLPSHIEQDSFHQH